MEQGMRQAAVERQHGRDASTPVADRPIFIVGAGRSGSTVFHRMFCAHPDVAWQSPVCDLFPAHPELNRTLLRVAVWPIGRTIATRWLRPGERYRFWEHWCHGFAQPCRDLVAADVTPLHRRAIPPALAQLATRRRRRVLVKITGWPRVGFLHELFPDARFVHVFRDGRAVAASLLAVAFWRGWRGPPGWGFGELDPIQRDEWERHGRSFVALAGIQWKLLMAAMDAAAHGVPSAQMLELPYEDFIADPVANFRIVAHFCGLEWTSGFERSIRRQRLETMNARWRESLSPTQQRTLEEVLAPTLHRYGYATAPARDATAKPAQP